MIVAERDPRGLEALDRGLTRLHDDARLFAAHVARGGVGLAPVARTDERLARRLLTLAEDLGLGWLYAPRIHELALEVGMMRTSGVERRELAIARWGDLGTEVPWDGRSTTVGDVARRMIAEAHRLGVEDHPPTIEPEHAARLLAGAIRSARLDCSVQLSHELVADAAVGDRTLYLAARRFRPDEVVRLAAHEVHGHLVAAENARLQRLAIFRVGTARSWEDQEGVSLVLEQRAGVFGSRRQLGVAARVLAVGGLLDGASRTETARALVREHGVPRDLAERAALRAFRAGGSLRDLSYVVGLARVRRALARREVTLHGLRTGKVSVEVARALPELRERGFALAPHHRPSLIRSLSATFSGTSFETSPPRRAASFTRLEAT